MPKGNCDGMSTYSALVGTFNQEKALVGAFSVIVKTECETDGSSAALTLAPKCLSFSQQHLFIFYFPGVAAAARNVLECNFRRICLYTNYVTIDF